jgi:hypothetical protein
VNYRGRAKGKTIQLEEPLPFLEGQAVNVFVEVCAEPSHLGSPQTVLQVARDLPHLRPFDVDELEAAIESARLPVHTGISLNEGK